MDTQRARKRRPVQPYPEFEDESWQPPAGEEADPERTAVHAERSRAIAVALTRITDDQRTAIVLYDIEGYDYGEIAEMTGVSLGTVKSRIHRGRLALRDILVRADGAVPWLRRSVTPGTIRCEWPRPWIAAAGSPRCWTSVRAASGCTPTWWR